MKTKSPVIRVVFDKTKRKKNGDIPLYILVTWRGTRAKESTKFFINESEIDSFELPEIITNRIKELEKVSQKFINDSVKLRHKGVNYNFTAREILDYNKEIVEEEDLCNENPYKVYIHILPNNCIYIGITKQKLERRWNEGEGYNENKFFYYNIKKYGWENIKHLLFKENLTEAEARMIEKDLITFYSNNEIDTGRVCINIMYNKKNKLFK